MYTYRVRVGMACAESRLFWPCLEGKKGLVDDVGRIEGRVELFSLRYLLLFGLVAYLPLGFRDMESIMHTHIYISKIVEDYI